MAAEVDVVDTVTSWDLMCFHGDDPPPPLEVPTCNVPVASKKHFPDATSAGVAVVSDGSAKSAVPPPLLWERYGGYALEQCAEQAYILSHIIQPPFQEMDRIFVVLSCEMVGRVRLP